MKQQRQLIRLYEAAAGQRLRIHTVPQGLAYAHFLRVGMNPGEQVRCLERLPGGTIILQKNRQQLAIGHALAEKILVLVLSTGDES